MNGNARVKRVCVRLVAMLWVLAFPVSAAEPTQDELTRAYNNASHELIECAAYFGISAQSIRKTTHEGSAELAERYEQMSDAAIAYAVHEADTINQKQEALEARMRLAMESMQEEIGADNINISILIDKYSKSCKVAVEDPVARLKYWIEKFAGTTAKQ